ncbi:gluconate 2-dehydrogenase subunit 3 family protein [Echinicola soli]|uniref:Gluconate 2-dehydrogenase subunit 3 family protein n=1 Tax=Echinicola soli TaxID=2591634 RepID=A0A514CF12_9BACT|nr:gluconate 2-dehydrogenase subunit 3 family protein [Echinicola soli]QDH78425.1 gluconate 2-dehydrogenase subunit 3 family protein [Echinicola soli]
MNRRLALKQLALAAGGLALIPSCDFSEEKVLAAYDELQITESQQKLLQKLVDTIIPKTDLKGATELGVHDFVLVMANDCMSAEEQKQFLSGLKGFDDYTKKTFGTRFTKMDNAEAEKNVNAILEGKPTSNGELASQYFLQTTKKYTIQGYLNSEYVMTALMPFQLVPGPEFNGKKEIVPGEKVNING